MDNEKEEQAQPRTPRSEATEGAHRAFVAASRSIDASLVQDLLKRYGIDSVTLQEAATPGSTWKDSLQRGLHEVDIVIGIIGESGQDENVFFELGYACAMNKRTLLFIPPRHPVSSIAMTGIPYIRTEPQNMKTISFGLHQLLSSPVKPDIATSGGDTCTRPIGQLADTLLMRLAQIEQGNESALEDLIAEAVTQSGVRMLTRQHGQREYGVDMAIWSSDLEPYVSNPLLIEIKRQLRSRAEIDQLIGRMYRELESIPNGSGLVIYRDADRKLVRTQPTSLPVFFISAEYFLEELRENSLAALVWYLRNPQIQR